MRKEGLLDSAQALPSRRVLTSRGEGPRPEAGPSPLTVPRRRDAERSPTEEMLEDALGLRRRTAANHARLVAANSTVCRRQLPR